MWGDAGTIGLYFVGCVILSFFAAYCLIYLLRFFPILAGGAHHINAIQSAHKTPTPRMGGVSIFLAFAIVAIFSPLMVSGTLVYFFLISVLTFAIGLFGDLGYELRPFYRLIFAVLTSLLVVMAYDVWLPRMGIPFVDTYMHYWYIGVPLTLLLTAGIINGFNLIDGVNGLCGSTAVISLVGLSAIAYQAGYTEYSGFVYLLIGAVIGFLILNFPSGKIFMGDAGAYTLGFVISWYGITIVINAPQVSPWAVFLTVFWPVLDTLLAMYRRFKRKTTTMAPDKLHVHQMVMRALEILSRNATIKHNSNPLSAALLVPLIAIITACGVIFWDQNLYAFWATMIFLVLFWVGYQAGIYILAKHPKILR